MGTTWHVTVVARGTASGLQEKIDRRLEEIEREPLHLPGGERDQPVQPLRARGRGVPGLARFPAGHEGRGEGPRPLGWRVGRHRPPPRRPLGVRPVARPSASPPRAERSRPCSADVGFAKIEIRPARSSSARPRSPSTCPRSRRATVSTRWRRSSAARASRVPRRDRRRGLRGGLARATAGRGGWASAAPGPTRRPTRSIGWRPCATRRSHERRLP